MVSLYTEKFADLFSHWDQIRLTQCRYTLKLWKRIIIAIKQLWSTAVYGTEMWTLSKQRLKEVRSFRDVVLSQDARSGLEEKEIK